MAKPVPPRFPPTRALNAEQNAFIQSLEPRPLHAVPDDTSPESPVDPSPQLPGDPSTGNPVDTSPRLSIDPSPEQPVDRSIGTLVSPETNHSVTQSPHHPVVQSPQRPRSRANKRQGRAVFERANGEPVRKLSFYIPADVAKSLQLHCVASERDMSTFVTDLVRRALAKASA